MSSKFTVCVTADTNLPGNDATHTHVDIDNDHYSTQENVVHSDPNWCSALQLPMGLLQFRQFYMNFKISGYADMGFEEFLKKMFIG